MLYIIRIFIINFTGKSMNPFMRIKLFLYPFVILALIHCYSCGKDNEVVEPIVNVSRDIVEVGNEVDYSDTVEITTNVSCTIRLSEGAESWLAVTPSISPEGGNSIVTIGVKANNYLPSQTATLSIMPEGSDVPVRQITITRKQFSFEWKKCYGGQGEDQFDAMTVLPNGQIVFSGFTQSGDGDALGYSGSFKSWVFRSNSDGSMIWQKQVVGTTGFISGQYRSVAATSDGGTVSAGYVNNNYNLDASVARYDANGNVIWNKTYGGTGQDVANRIINTPDGGFLVSAETNSQDGDVKLNHGAFDLWVFKLDANGNLIWEKTFGGAADDILGGIATCSDGGYMLSGMSKSNATGDVPASHGNEDIFVVKLDAAGNKVWTKTFGGTLREDAGSVIGDTDGGCIIAACTNSSDGDLVGRKQNLNRDMWVFKLNKDGQIVWKTTLGGGREDFANSLARLPNGNIAIAGSSESNNGDVAGNLGGHDVWVVVLNSRGKKLWQRTFGSYTGDYNSDIKVTADGSLLVANSTDGNELDVSDNHGNDDAWVFKLK
jgi:hypothetical protein